MGDVQWRVWVDWDGDGVWGEEGEEVTGEVMALRWRCGREGDGHRAVARLELTLRNEGYKYTPGNGRSPLAGKLRAGRRVWALLAYPYDDFNGPEGSELAGCKAAVGAAAVWVKETGGSSGVVIRGNRAQGKMGSGESIYTLDFGTGDGSIGFYYRRGSDGKGGIVLRLVSVWDYLRVRFGERGTVLERVSFGFASTLRRGPALAAGVNYFVEVELHGEEVRLFATDLDGGTADRRQILDGQGAAGNLTATKHGLWTDGTTEADSWGEFGGWRSLFFGAVEALSPGRDERMGEVCRLAAVDELAGLERVALFNLLTGRNLNAAAIANRILTWAGFDLQRRRLDGGTVLTATEPRALWGWSAAAALAAVAREANGLVYQDGRGYARLEAAGHRAGAAHQSSRVALGDGSAAGPYFAELTVKEGGDGVENGVIFRYRRVENRGLQEIWRLRETAAIPAGERRDFLAESGAYAVAEGVRLPLATVDYAANSRADGTGADLTGSLTVSLPFAGGNGAGYRGKGTVVRAANGHRTATAYVTLLRLRADRAYREYEAVSCAAEDAGSQGSYGRRFGAVECRFIDHYAAARAAAETRLAERKGPRRRLTARLPGGTEGNLRELTQRVLSERARVSSGERGIDGEFYIEGMELRAAAGGELTGWWELREV